MVDTLGRTTVIGRPDYSPSQDIGFLNSAQEPAYMDSGREQIIPTADTPGAHDQFAHFVDPNALPPASVGGTDISGVAAAGNFWSPYAGSSTPFGFGDNPAPNFGPGPVVTPDFGSSFRWDYGANTPDYAGGMGPVDWSRVAQPMFNPAPSFAQPFTPSDNYQGASYNDVTPAEQGFVPSDIYQWDQNPAPTEGQFTPTDIYQWDQNPMPSESQFAATDTYQSDQNPAPPESMGNHPTFDEAGYWNQAGALNDWQTAANQFGEGGFGYDANGNIIPWDTGVVASPFEGAASRGGVAMGGGGGADTTGGSGSSPYDVWKEFDSIPFPDQSGSQTPSWQTHPDWFGQPDPTGHGGDAALQFALATTPGIGLTDFGYRPSMSLTPEDIGADQGGGKVYPDQPWVNRGISYQQFMDGLLSKVVAQNPWAAIRGYTGGAWGKYSNYLGQFPIQSTDPGSGGVLGPNVVKAHLLPNSR